MLRKQTNRQVSVSKTNGKAATHSERAEFVSFAQGRSSYIERGWANAQEWAAVERPDRQPAPMLTPEALRVLAEERNHVANNRD